MKDLAVLLWGWYVLHWFFFCLSAANKAATFTWEKDGEEIEENIEKEDEKSKLRFKNMMLSDSGKYTCIANFGGEELEDSVNIYVHGKKSHSF